MKLNQIKLLLVGLAEYYRTSLTENQITMYAEDLSDLSLEEIARAIKLARRNPAYQFFPLPAQIKAMLHSNEKDQAIECVSLIVSAMAKFGWNNPDRARSYVGELAWKVVEREGGWQSICERTSNEQLPILKSQWRETARVIVDLNLKGLNFPPSLQMRNVQQISSGTKKEITKLLNLKSMEAK